MLSLILPASVVPSTVCVLTSSRYYLPPNAACPRNKYNKDGGVSNIHQPDISLVSFVSYADCRLHTYVAVATISSIVLHFVKIDSNRRYTSVDSTTTTIRIDVV
jgi:hypothetical protein